MRGTVLKNRLLDLTERSFDEADYGANRFGDLVEQLDELLEVDYSAMPFLVELREPFRSGVQAADFDSVSSSGRMVRSDLWHAIVDYSHGKQWIWDQTAEMAVAVQEGFDCVDGIFLPTLEKHILHSWRVEFAEELLTRTSGAEAVAVKEWAHKDLGTAALPKRFRRLWNARMRDRVHERLIEFFEMHKLEPPKDLLVERRPRRPVDELRSYVLRCIALMNDRELKELQIPAGIAWRARR